MIHANLMEMLLAKNRMIETALRYLTKKDGEGRALVDGVIGSYLGEKQHASV